MLLWKPSHWNITFSVPVISVCCWTDSLFRLQILIRFICPFLIFMHCTSASIMVCANVFISLHQTHFLLKKPFGIYWDNLPEMSITLTWHHACLEQYFTATTTRHPGWPYCHGLYKRWNCTYVGPSLYQSIRQIKCKVLLDASAAAIVYCSPNYLPPLTKTDILSLTPSSFFFFSCGQSFW